MGEDFRVQKQEVGRGIAIDTMESRVYDEKTWRWE